MALFKRENEESVMPNDFTGNNSKHEPSKVLEGTGIKVTGLVVGIQSTASRADDNGVVTDGKHYLLLACRGMQGIKLKMKNQPDPEVYVEGTIHTFTVALSAFQGTVFYSQI